MKELVKKIVDRFNWYDVFDKYWVLIVIIAILAIWGLYFSVFSSLLSSPIVMAWLHTPVTAMEIKDVCIIAFIAAVISKWNPPATSLCDWRDSFYPAIVFPRMACYIQHSIVHSNPPKEGIWNIWKKQFFAYTTVCGFPITQKKDSGVRFFSVFCFIRRSVFFLAYFGSLSSPVLPPRFSVLFCVRYSCPAMNFSSQEMCLSTIRHGTNILHGSSHGIKAWYCISPSYSLPFSLTFRMSSRELHGIFSKRIARKFFAVFIAIALALLCRGDFCRKFSAIVL